MSGPVLIVDDDDALSDNLAEIIGTLGVRTMIARDRQTALSLAAAHDFDVAADRRATSRRRRHVVTRAASRPLSLSCNR